MNAITVWFLFSFSQVVLSRILLPPQTKPLRWITFLAPMLIWLCEPRDLQAGRLYASSATILAKCKSGLFLMLKEVCRGFKEELFSI
ncbi:hypothetical protein J5N97_013874 [Dioscorea zingiberensis]|uniref:Secreted protein n=1 Tax=Dioscorea zingiberensis TaxID=325984 RepID=A0A9D5CU61_9LILI|nr:hypothetical protein J5N97_013874 [Dioscorea zingiberensis]